MPPAPLVAECEAPETRTIETNRDLIDSRQDWITHFGMCAVKIDRLREWYAQRKKDVQQPQPAVGARVGLLPD